MPIYEYTCQKCKARVEVMRKVTDKPLTKCGKCGGRLEKEWSRTGIQFKGTGWYVTDYAGRKGDPAADPATASAGGDGDSKAEAKDVKDAKDTKETKEAKADNKFDAKSDSKPAAKKTPKQTSTSKGAGKD